ncbi:MAG: sigma-70 family RNA polymerase sigma factor [Gaiellales bacterium]|nr:MAG: sigma-70 family RNA polymerase sigma factor [Gaiellales bacterium]
MMMELTDSQLALMAGRGDADACRRLFERYQHPVYNFVYRMVDNAEDASDIVQDAFIKVYNVLGRQEVRNFSAYLYRTARNLAYDEMRRRSRFADVDQELLAPEDPNIYADPQRALLLAEQMQKVRQAAGGLSENQRAALVLRELEGLDYDQMAEVMESNRNAVGALLSRARLKFREELRMAQVRTDMAPEECEEAIALLSPYIDGELAGEDIAYVERHLEQCGFCAAAFEEMREASRSFRVLIPVIPPADMAEAFTRRLREAGDAAAQTAGGQATDTAPAGSRSLASRFMASRITWAVTALVAAAGLGLFLIAGEVGRDRDVAATRTGEGGAAGQRDDTNDGLREMPGVGPAHGDGIDLQGAQDGQPGADGRAEPGQDDPGETAAGMVVSGYATPNPVKQYSRVTVTVEVTGSPGSVSVAIGDAMTVKLARQYATPDGEVWSWAGNAQAPGYYVMTASAAYPGATAEAMIGALEVVYTLY